MAGKRINIFPESTDTPSIIFIAPPLNFKGEV